jgi:gliding motility-associated-like protein
MKTFNLLPAFTVPLSNYQWSTGETSAEISITEPGLYRLNHEGSCGLTSDEVFATGCMPRVYLPNVIDLDASDPANQVLLPGVAHGVLTRMEVYDRWGSLVYEESPVSKGWDGRWNGQRCLPGVYVYRVAYRRPEGVEEEWVLGDVTLF